MIERASLHLQRPTTRSEFERWVAEGRLDADARFDLVDGEVVKMSPEGPEHSAISHRLACLLEDSFGHGFHARQGRELDIAPDERNANPMPDVAVVDGGPLDRRYDRVHPKLAHVVVEVSVTTLAGDRERKASIYAKAQIPEHWIIDVEGRAIEVHTKPIPSAAGSFGWLYGTIEIVREGSVKPLASKGRAIALDEVF